MRFELIRENSECEKVIYQREEQFFETTSNKNADLWLLINYLNIGFSSNDKRLKNIWGWSSTVSWAKKTLEIPDTIEGDLVILDNCEPGISYRLDKKDSWNTYYDIKRKWFCTCKNSLNEGFVHVRVGENVIITLSSEGELEALWIGNIPDV